jgi:hypothetical protein
MDEPVQSSPPGVPMSSSPPPTSSSMSSPPPASKIKKMPTVTPRRFKRFFTPRTSRENRKMPMPCRNALMDITTSGLNRRVGSGNEDGEGYGKGNKRMLLTPSPGSSPCKRPRGSNDGPDPSLASISSDIEEESEGMEWKARPPCMAVTKSRFRQALGHYLRRETGWAASAHALAGHRGDWQSEVANFCSGKNDQHAIISLGTLRSHAIPYCTTSCNSMPISLTAQVRNVSADVL